MLAGVALGTPSIMRLGLRGNEPHPVARLGLKPNIDVGVHGLPGIAPVVQITAANGSVPCPTSDVMGEVRGYLNPRAGSHGPLHVVLPACPRLRPDQRTRQNVTYEPGPTRSARGQRACARAAVNASRLRAANALGVEVFRFQPHLSRMQDVSNSGHVTSGHARLLMLSERSVKLVLRVGRHFSPEIPLLDTHLEG